MEVILKKDVPNVGRMGEIVDVRPGFARNFLLPRSLAILASKSNKRMLEHQRRLVESQKKKVRAESEERAKEISKIKITISRRFNEQDKMFGSINPQEIVEAIKEHGYEFDRRDIELGEIREAGTYEVRVRLPGDVYTQIQLKVEAIKEETKKAKKAKSAKKATKSAKAKKSSESSKEDESETKAEGASEPETVE